MNTTDLPTAHLSPEVMDTVPVSTPAPTTPQRTRKGRRGRSPHAETPPSKTESEKTQTRSTQGQVWDKRAAGQLIHETMTRVGKLFPPDFNVDTYQERWDCLEAAISRADRLQNFDMLGVALSRFEQGVAEMFEEHHQAKAEAALLPPADLCLDFWFESLPVARSGGPTSSVAEPAATPTTSAQTALPQSGQSRGRSRRGKVA